MSINYQLFDVPPHSRDVGSPVAGTVETLDELKEKLIAGVELGLDWAIIIVARQTKGREMTTATDFAIVQTDHDGIRTWHSRGKVDPAQFLLSLLEQFNESVTERVKDNCRVPKLSDVNHAFGMPAECMDGYWVDAEIHDGLCEDPSTCDFKQDKCWWQTFVYDEGLIVDNDERA